MSKKISRREFLNLSAVTAAGALLAACVPKPTPTPAVAAPTATPKPAVGPTATTAPAKWPRGAVPRERTVIWSNGGPTFPLNAGNPYSPQFNHQNSYALHLEAMWYYTALNDKTYSHLAESYQYNSDATELTVKLRKGIEWSDGKPFTAKDIAFTYNSLIARAPDLRDSARLKVLTKEVVAVDDYTAKFVLVTPNWRYHRTECTFRFDIGTYLVPEHVYKDIQGDWRQFEFSPAKNPAWPLVTGAYKMSEDTPDHRNFDLRDDWWAVKTGFMKKPQVERLINIPFTDDTLAAEQIINNQIDFCLDLRPRVMETILARGPHVISFTGRNKPYGYVDWWPISMHINNLEWPYNDVRVRWAMAYAIDQNQVLEVGWAGAGTTTAYPFPDYPGLLKYTNKNKDLLQKYNVLEYNLDKSASLMKEAGFAKNAEGFWAKDGKVPDADLYAGVPLFGDIAPVISEQLRKAGFKSTHATPPDVWDRKIKGTGFLCLFGHGGSVDDPFTTLDQYHSRNVKPTGTSSGWFNISRWSNAEYDKLVEELTKTSPDKDEPKCQELFRKAFEIWLRELPEVPLVQWYHRIPMNTTYWDNWPTSENPYNSALWHETMPITLWFLKAKK